jgi:hypothetical protein
MMMKVDSGGHGDCSVYNYTGFESDGTTPCDSTALTDLLSANDYKMPKAKNALNYYYGVNCSWSRGRHSSEWEKNRRVRRSWILCICRWYNRGDYYDDERKCGKWV